MIIARGSIALVKNAKISRTDFTAISAMMVTMAMLPRANMAAKDALVLFKGRTVPVHTMKLQILLNVSTAMPAIKEIIAMNVQRDIIKTSRLIYVALAFAAVMATAAYSNSVIQLEVAVTHAWI